MKPTQVEENQWLSYFRLSEILADRLRPQRQVKRDRARELAKPLSHISKHDQTVHKSKWCGSTTSSPAPHLWPNPPLHTCWLLQIPNFVGYTVYTSILLIVTAFSSWNPDVSMYLCGVWCDLMWCAALLWHSVDCMLCAVVLSCVMLCHVCHMYLYVCMSVSV